MNAESIKRLIARAYSDKISVDNTIAYLRARPETGAKLLADYEAVARDLGNILEDLDDALKSADAKQTSHT